MALMDRLNLIVSSYRSGTIKPYVAHEQVRAVAQDLNLGLADVAFTVLLELDRVKRELANTQQALEAKGADFLAAAVSRNEYQRQARDLGRALVACETRLRIALEQQL